MIMSEDKPEHPMYGPWTTVIMPKSHRARKIGGGSKGSGSKSPPAHRRIWFDIMNQTKKGEREGDRENKEVE